MRNRGTSYGQISEVVQNFWDLRAFLDSFCLRALSFTIGMREKIGGLDGMLTIRIGAGTSGVASACLFVAHTGFLILKGRACLVIQPHLCCFGNGAPYCTR